MASRALASHMETQFRRVSSSEFVIKIIRNDDWTPLTPDY